MRISRVILRRYLSLSTGLLFRGQKEPLDPSPITLEAFFLERRHLAISLALIG